MVGLDGELNRKPVISMEPFKLFWIVNLLLPVLTFVRVESTVYRAYELVPHIKLDTNQVFIGEFASYSRLESTPESQSTYLPLVFVNDGFGCPGNDTDSQPLSNSILLLRLTQECTDYQQASAAQRLGVQGLIFYYTPDTVDKSLGSRYAERLSDITVVALELGESDIEDLMANSPRARIDPFYHKSFFQTSHTFYFVVFAFCILMLLSCLWCILSYIRRCQYNVRNRRRRVGTRNLSYVCVPTPAMFHVNKADPTVHGDNHGNDIINLGYGDKYVAPCKLNLHICKGSVGMWGSRMYFCLGRSLQMAFCRPCHIR